MTAHTVAFEGLRQREIKRDLSKIREKLLEYYRKKQKSYGVELRGTYYT